MKTLELVRVDAERPTVTIDEVAVSTRDEVPGILAIRWDNAQSQVAETDDGSPEMRNLELELFDVIDGFFRAMIAAEDRHKVDGFLLAEPTISTVGIAQIVGMAMLQYRLAAVGNINTIRVTVAVDSDHNESEVAE